MRFWPRLRRKQVYVDVTEVQRAKAQRAEAQRRLARAHERLAHDQEVTIRPLSRMIRENHISEHLDSIVQKVRRSDPGPNPS